MWQPCQSIASNGDQKEDKTLLQHSRAVHTFFYLGGGGLGPDQCKRYRVVQDPLDAAERQCAEVRSVDQSARSAENFFTLISQLSGQDRLSWHLRALHCKFQM